MEHSSKPFDTQAVTIVYDGQCPFCANYVRQLRLKMAVGTVNLYDARAHSWVVEELAKSDIKLDEGMYVQVGKEKYCGADAIWVLASMSSKVDLFNRINFFMFSSKRISRFLYPIMRSIRNVTLFLIGVPKLNANK